MNRRRHPVWNHIWLFFWVVFLFELIVFGLALLFGQYLGYARAFTVCFWIGVIIGASFLSIFLLNLLEILLRHIYHIVRK